MGMREIGLLAAPCAFGAVSGFSDGGNLLAALTAGRVISPRAAWALLCLSLVGPLLVGTQVARTVDLSVVDLRGQGAAGLASITIAAGAVTLGSWRARVPTSLTLALIGAMVGWVLAGAHDSTIRWAGLLKVVLGTPISVIGGLACAFLVYRGARRALSSVSHGRALALARAQYATGALQAIAYGSNDMEKTIGLVVVAEAIARNARITAFAATLPLLLAFGSFSLGSLVGGWRIARRLRAGVFRARPVQALSVQLGASVAVLGLALAGAPVSSTQTTGGSLVGVGLGVRPSGVRWGTVRTLLASWLVTLPAALLAGLLLHAALRALAGAT